MPTWLAFNSWQIWQMLRTLLTVVKNHAGTLSRVASLFRRRSFNIESLTVCATENPRISRMTIAIWGDDAHVLQVQKQLEKLVDVLEVHEITLKNGIIRETLLLRCPGGNAAQLADFANNAGMQEVEKGTFETTDSPQIIDDIANKAQQISGVEVTRTGGAAVLVG